MIIVIDALNRDRFGDLLDEMFQLRARVFGDRLGWEVEVRDGREVDRFDALDPAYLVGLDEGGHVVSCTRLLQTTGPHMLADVFHAILDGEPPLRSARLWEATRFCVDTRRLKETGGLSGISRATCEIIIGINDYGMNAGIADIAAVIDPVLDRVLKRSACAPYDYIGSTKPMGKVPAMAALLDCTEARSRAVRAFSGIEGSVFLSDDEALALFARSRTERAPQRPTERAPEAGMPAARSGGAGSCADNVVPFPPPRPARTAITAAEALAYCLALIRAAEDDEERRKACTVACEILTGTGLAQEIEALAHALRAPVQAAGH